MSNKEFKPGDLIFLIDRVGYVRLVRYVTNYGSKTVETIDTETDNDYLGYGFLATPENREALVTLYSEDEVPELPLRGSELTKKLLKQQKYVLCLVSNINEDNARRCDPPKVRTVCGVTKDWFDLTDGLVAEFAIPVDMNGNEILEIEE